MDQRPALMVAPWGIILLVLLGLASVLLGARSIVDDIHTRRERQALQPLLSKLQQAIDSVAALSCRVR